MCSSTQDLTSFSTVAALSSVFKKSHWCFSVRHSMLGYNQGCGLRLRGWDAFVMDNWFSCNGDVGFSAREENSMVIFTGNRVEYNKRVLKMGDNGEEITPNGGFLHYGLVKNGYVLIHGSIPGPTKRLIKFSDPIRATHAEVEQPELTYISKESKQGV